MSSESGRGGFFIGVDCGGTNLRAAAAGEDGVFLAELVVPTGDAASRENGLGEAILSTIRDLVSSMEKADGEPHHSLGRHATVAPRVLGVGIGLPFVCHEGRAYLCRNVSALDPILLETAIRSEWACPSALLNDVKCAALGESWIGAARNADPFIFLNVGTGLSSAFYSDGRILMGAHNASGEIGYWVAEAADESGFSEGFGPLEEAMSGVGLSGAYRRASEKAGEAVASFSAEEVFARARSGEPRASAVVESGVRFLLAAMANLSIMLDPSLFVIGGGVSKSLTAYKSRIEAYLGRMVPFPPRVLFSSLGGKAGLVGAVRLAMSAAGH